MKRLLPIGLLAACVFALPASASHSLGVKWRGHAPLTLKVKIDVTGANRDATLRSMELWSRSSVIDLVETDSTKAKIKVVEQVYPGCPNACAPYDARNGWLTEASVVLNPTWGAGITQMVRELAFCHEMGHTLGLSHNPETTSCLYATTAGSTVPNAHDYEELELIYD